MPRSSQGAAAAKKKKETKTIKIDEAEGRDGDAAAKELDSPYVPKQGIFEFVVLTFAGLLPTDEGYDPEKDKLMIGFRYGSRTPPSWLPLKTELTDITAYDFLTNPKTGKRPGQSSEPSGATNTHLISGISDWTDLPPLFIWKNGKWLTEVIKMPEFDIDSLPSWMKNKAAKYVGKDWEEKGVPAELYQYYVTSGEGTIGNSIYRIFELPTEVCGNTNPHHPLMWKEELKKSRTSPSNAHKGESWREASAPMPSTAAPWRPGSLVTTTATKPATTPTPKKVVIPQGVRLRCEDCGHWFSYQDLITHSGLCGDPDKRDWAIMCVGDCGCQTLDEVTRPKEGFPRPKKKAATKKKAEVAVVSDSKELSAPAPATLQ